MWSRSASRGSRALLLRGSAVTVALFAATVASTGSALADTDPTITLAPSTGTASCTWNEGDVSPSDTAVAYGGTVTLHLPPLLRGGAGFVGYLQTDVGVTNYSTADGWSGMSLSDDGGGTYRIVLPNSDLLRQTPGGLQATLEMGPLTSSLPGTQMRADNRYCSLHLTLTTTGTPALTLSPGEFFLADLPSTSVPAGGRLVMTLPSGSVLHRLGVATVRDLHVSLFTRQEGGEVLSRDVTFSADGRTATLQIPSAAEPGVHYLEVQGSTTSLYGNVTVTAPVATASSAPVGPAAVAPATTPAPSTTSAQPAPDGVAAAATAQPDLRSASNSSVWVAWTGLGVAVVALAGGAVFLVRRRMASR